MGRVVFGPPPLTVTLLVGREFTSSSSQKRFARAAGGVVPAAGGQSSREPLGCPRQASRWHPRGSQVVEVVANHWPLPGRRVGDRPGVRGQSSCNCRVVARNTRPGDIRRAKAANSKINRAWQIGKRAPEAVRSPRAQQQSFRSMRQKFLGESP